MGSFHETKSKSLAGLFYIRKIEKKNLQPSMRIEVLRVESVTFCDPFIQEILQN